MFFNKYKDDSKTLKHEKKKRKNKVTIIIVNPM